MEQKKTKKGAPPRYDEAFKSGAIKMVTEGQRPAQEVAKELGVCIDTLRSWLKSSGQHPTELNRENRAMQRLKELEAENRALRKTVTEKDEVIDILKKSVGIISRP